MQILEPYLSNHYAFKKLIYSAAVMATAAMLAPSCGRQSQSVSIATVEENFMSPPDSIRIAAYWYWINDNLSPEGAVKDLRAMKKAGITRAQIGMIGGTVCLTATVSTTAICGGKHCTRR